MSDETKENTDGTESKHVNIKVLGQDNSVIQFKLKKLDPMWKLMNAYCDRVGTSMQVVRFRFNGLRIYDNDTPTILALEKGDIIEVFQQQTGGQGDIF